MLQRYIGKAVHELHFLRSSGQHVFQAAGEQVSYSSDRSDRSKSCHRLAEAQGTLDRGYLLSVQMHALHCMVQQQSQAAKAPEETSEQSVSFQGGT